MMKLRIGMMWTMGLLTVALAVVLMGVFHAGTASAKEDSVTVTGVQAQTQAGDKDVGVRFREVWSAILTVGKAAGEESGVQGYASGGSEEFGSLDDTTFTDRGTEYSVGRLVHKAVGGKHFLLYLEPGHALDPNMVFEVDGKQYAVLDSSPQRGDETTHGWLLDSSLGWEEGDTMTVKMLIIELYVRGSEGQALAHADG